MRITILGAGYVGLVSGACLADFGHRVTCVDAAGDMIRILQNGEIPIYEPGLKELIAANVGARRIDFTTELAPAAAEAEVVFVAVGTPARRGDGRADLVHVHRAARELAAALRGFTVIATKSTVPVGTGDEIERIVAEANPAANAVVVANPEFLREGSAIKDFKRPDRIVVGTDDERARAIMAEVYRPLRADQTSILFTSRRSAELAKYAANAFLAMKVTFINEIADLCEATGADVEEVARTIGLDRRIGTEYLRAGLGFGGSCLPKDTNALAKIARDLDSPLRLVEATVAVNEERKRAMARKVVAACGGSVRDKRIGVLGLTFKPDTDDMRDASSPAIIKALQAGGATIAAYDPAGMIAARTLLEGVDFAADPYEAAAGASALVIVTEWDAFRTLDFERLKTTMAAPVLIDLRNMYKPNDVVHRGFRYIGVGRSASGGGRVPTDAAE